MPVPVPRQRTGSEVEQTAAAPDTADSTPATGATTHSQHPATPRQPAEPAAQAGEAGGTPAQPASRPTGATEAGGAPEATGATGATGAPKTSKAPGASEAPAVPRNLTLLVIEDDPTGPFSVPELPEGGGTRVRIRTARNLTEASRLLTDDIDCLLVDLALPGGSGTRAPEDDGLGPLSRVLRLAPRHAVLALAAEGDAERAAAAVRAGAQDYLFRDELDGRLLSRAIRYAVERKRADGAQRQLTESRLHAQENARLERGLLPTPLLDGSDLRFASRYRPGRSRALLGGDFYDTIRTPDGTVHAMIGDVCGHGPDEAALGVELRIAWRALTLAGTGGDELLATLQQVLEHERESEEIFATLCAVDIAPDGRSADVRLAGHPAPLIARSGERARLMSYDCCGPALGLLPGGRWPSQRVELGDAWNLMIYTDGLIEGRVGAGSNRRLGEDGMADMINEQLADGLYCDALIEAALARVEELNGGELTDDVAVLLLGRGENAPGLPALAGPAAP
ncbi:PP2C family protein-serine/threonine phosphatase [Streptomyces sp. 8L]|uniref:PP2C family protein-serine/threonine phosphatase n=1 Tax=Streptomyces sp. 8L TaxID=2877242 RepID=UPI001CD6C15B|nr:fused response regulator/phosphatase [Streptomyces sp. 8L]MCA1221435.1 SpoIIE family protein phosphatase [Streptomyces sp. 8L]